MRSRAVLLLLTVLGFALRMHALGDVPLRWDEGWSIALAVLPVPETLRLTALDVHPPLYYMILAPWMALARGPELWPRLVSAFVSTVAIPISAAAAGAWWSRSGATYLHTDRMHAHRARTGPSRRVGVATAAYVAVAPAFVYYAGVTRMYALTTPLLFLAAFGVAGCGQGRRGILAAVVGATGALYSFYYTGFALAGLFLAGLIAWPAAWRRLAGAAAIASVAFAPWLAYAAPLMASRVGERTDAGNALDPRAVMGLLDDGLFAAVFAYRAGWPAVAALGLVLLAAVALARTRPWRRFWVVVLPVFGTLVGGAVGSQAHMFAARYVIVATPFVALGIGWSVAALSQRSRLLGVAAATTVLAAVLPTLAGYAYAREAEVSGAYDPTEPARVLSEVAQASDLVAFNILSLAGAYELYRGEDSPDWTYGQVWDPVREDPELATARVAGAVRDKRRLWLVLYRGTASPGSEALKAWADASLFPAAGQWTADTLYQGYANAPLERRQNLEAAFASSPILQSAEHTRRAKPGGEVAVLLRWRADQPATGDSRVFVHLYDEEQQLVAQHDAYAVADSRPPRTWQPGEVLEDRHGLFLPDGIEGTLSLEVGLYDPTTGLRRISVGGLDRLPIGRVEIVPAGGR